MKIVFLDTSTPSVRCFTDYYNKVFTEGSQRAHDRMRRTLEILAAHPYIGRLSAEGPLREVSIPRTPFSIIYRPADDHIEILAVWDQRADRTNLDLPDEGPTSP